MRPNALVARAYLARGAWLWLATRLLVMLAFLWADLDPLQLSLGIALQVIVLSVVAGFLDVHRRRERALLGNLGIGSRPLGAMFLAPAVAGEVAFWLSVAARS
jgi:hypothetical protein